MDYLERKKLLEDLIEYIKREAGKESMSEEFVDGLNCTILKIKQFGGIEIVTKKEE